MKYSVEWLLMQEAIDLLFFWGHRPSKDGSIIKTCFSQWWVSAFTEQGITYKTAEHYMMAGKARVFNDEAMLKAIVETESPASVKSLGRKVKNFDPAVWDKAKYEIVKQGNYLKFSQHPALKAFLLQTGNAVIVEASPFDRIWGIGMAESDERANRPKDWNGQNLLGFALMEVRDRLREEN
ncbi:MAG: NADAR family protein [Sediminibacterium sp.]|nr:NADAR family protein [Sediminibacterium sp.]